MSNLIITGLPQYANAITHSGRFTASEILSAVVLSKSNDDILRLARLKTGSLSAVPKTAIAFGKGSKYDVNGEKRPNGIPYSSAGLIWKEFGMQLLKNEDYIEPKKLWAAIDEALFQPIDAIEAGYMPTKDYRYKALSLYQIIDMFNPWSETATDTDYNGAFETAFNLMLQIFEQTINYCLTKNFEA